MASPTCHTHTHCAVGLQHLPARTTYAVARLDDLFYSKIPHKEKLGNINPLTCSHRATSSSVMAETQAEPADTDREEVGLQRGLLAGQQAPI